MYPNVSVGMNYGLPVPYQRPLPSGLTPSTQIHVSGTPTGSRFEVNLKNYQDDFLLHFNPRFDDNILVLNSAERGSWANEERHPLPMYRGQRFTMIIIVTDRSIRIAVNNAHVCEFYFRAPMHIAQLFEVKGEINLESVQVYSSPHSMSAYDPSMGMNMNMGYAPPPPTMQPNFGGDFNAGFGFPSAPPPPFDLSAPAPFMGSGGVPSIQSCRITTGSRIFVRGFIPHGANRFELNFLQGYQDSDDVAFHFNPRFDQRTIVKNYRQNGQWGQEENQPFPMHMPLYPGTPIDLQITCGMDRYMVYMNNALIAEYFHKIPPGYVMAVQYKGDIQVSGIGQM